MTDEQPMGSKEACAILRIDRATLIRWVAQGKLAARRLSDTSNGAYMFDRADVERLASEKATA
jgi:predicted site-specific integrase-resolvase